MTALLRYRGALSEIEALFAAEPEGTPAWAPLIWPGEPAVVVTERDGRRSVTSRPWGLPKAAFVDPSRSRARRAIVVPRELRADAGMLIDPGELERCLLVLEAFAYPDGPAGQRTRSWTGLWDRPLAGWAGFGVPGGHGCAGVLVMANPLIARVSRHMPLLAHPDEFGAWLDGSAIFPSLSAITDEQEFYVERTDERWSMGVSPDDQS
ncbi:hypothetical protein [Stakelama saccharophila]|uniref:SOS response-associated peptidase YedK n=1 Tax=Stakelama saccharophila TaxID=3075605 RepID=A0ABZ0BA18_9SPHN|nr:hypothetical protein [Stakelama sp. W311]WNO54120.1 hypothetical protein RPR59_02335 [Stakelama sp. W311]